MNIIKSLTILILGAQFMSCQEPQEAVIDIMPIDTLAGEIFHRAETDLLISNDLKINDSYIFAVNLTNEAVFRCYATTGEDNNNYFGTKGNARNEFMFPIFANNHSQKNNQHISVFDMHKGHIYNIGFDGDSYAIEIEESYKKLINSFNINIVDENIIVGNKVDTSEGLFYIYDTQKHTFNWIEYRDKDIKFNDYSYYELYYNILDFSHATNEVVIAMRYFNKILFYNINSNDFKEIQIGRIKQYPKYTNTQTVSLDDSAIVFLDICISNEYIYGLMLNNDDASILIKLNTSGELINCIYLDRLVFRIEAYEDEYIYAVSNDGTGLTDIIKYDISEL